MNSLLGRPTYLSADLGFTAILLHFFFYSSSIFCRPLPNELAKRNSTKTGHMLGSTCDLKVRNVGVSPPLKNLQPKTRLFRLLRNLTATLTVCIFGMKHDIDNRASALETRRGLLRRLKTT